MTTTQTIILGILGLLVIISFVFTNMVKKDENKTIFTVLWLFISAFLIIIAMVSTSEMNRLKKLNGKCPEYERIENVYKLKENK